MIVVEVSSDLSEEEFKTMKVWCKQIAMTPFYCFEPNELLEEKAKFWFSCELDAFTFQLRFGLV